MRSQDHSQCSSHVVQGELLPTINDDVDIVLGLAVFYQYIQAGASIHQGPTQYVSVLTTELFAYYLHIKYFLLPMCHYFMQISSTDEFKRYKIRISDTARLFVGDMLLFVSLSRFLREKFHHRAVWRQRYQPTINPSKQNASDLVELLQKSAVEHFTIFRQMQALDFASEATTVTTDYEALYAYKRGDYQQCLQLSTQSERTLIYVACMKVIPAFPEFVQLMDDDIVSLISLMLIVDPKCRYDHDDGDDRSRYVFITQLALSLYLMTQCQLKLRHSATSLAQTLDYIGVAQRRHQAYMTLNKLILKLIERKIVSYIAGP